MWHLPKVECGIYGMWHLCSSQHQQKQFNGVIDSYSGSFCHAIFALRVIIASCYCHSMLFLNLKFVFKYLGLIFSNEFDSGLWSGWLFFRTGVFIKC